ncbi:uncharacterized protein L3040_002575 [Drepanopeziza brunnea f. sp. 'multigermtubi']|uniref:uncharacterized protein n=1 Tax=Drepanopeziza brunnea f. sp. 'multigermtubi' TaxID=698441 RepID=UPI002395BE7D|nr:hypothetical protein L3040_002575 [Drepanopeziza brunnea f. sp. 'multigermtubi']
MRVLYLLSLLVACLGSEGLVKGLLFDRDGVVAAPNCSVPCLTTLIPKYCNSAANTTCVCANTELRASVLSCSYAACDTFPELFQLQKYAAVSCGITSDKSRLMDVLRASCIVPALTLLFLLGRVTARIRLAVGLGADDWMILAAAAAYYIDMAISLGLVGEGFGQNQYWLEGSQIVNGLKHLYAATIFYMIAITLTKMALLLFFLRIFPDRKLRRAIYMVGLLIVLSNFSILVALIFQCIPISGFWTNWRYKERPVKCISQYPCLEAAAVFAIIHSFLIIALPIPTVWKLNLVWQKKANLMIMFCVGSLALVCSFMRLPSLIKMSTSKDLSWDSAPLVVYSHLEQSIGIICACLPACRSLLEYYFPSLKMHFGESEGTRVRTHCMEAHTYHHQTPPKGYHEKSDRSSSSRCSFVEMKDRCGASSQSSSSCPSAGKVMVSVEAGGAAPNEDIRKVLARGSDGIYMTRSVEMSSAVAVHVGDMQK